MLVSIHAELGMNLFLDGLLMQGGQLGQVIGPPVLALMVSMGGGWKSAPWLLGGAAAVGVALSLGLGVLEKRRVSPLGEAIGHS
jgi:MFS family permease